MWRLDPTYVRDEDERARAWLSSGEVRLRRMPDKHKMYTDGPERILEGWLPSEPLADRDTRVIAFGSCFASRFAEWLADNGYNRRFDPDSDQSLIRSQMESPAVVAQQFRWAFGEMDPQLAFWMDRERRQIEATEERRVALHDALSSAEVLVITLGLSEVWFDTLSGEPIWRVPPRSLGSHRYGLKLATVAESVEALETIDRLRRAHVPDQKIVLTVSPQRMGATFRGISPLVANAASKAILRAAVDEFLLAHAGELNQTYFYFPGYELATELLHDPFEDNMHLRDEAVGYILGVFARCYLGARDEVVFPASPQDELLRAISNLDAHATVLQQVCDDRLKVIQDLDAACKSLERACDDRQRVVEQLDSNRKVLERICEERLVVIEQLEAQVEDGPGGGKGREGGGPVRDHALRTRLTELEAENDSLRARMRYPRYRAVDRLSQSAKRFPALHRPVKSLVERRWLP
jgi:hypothetical protein